MRAGRLGRRRSWPRWGSWSTRAIRRVKLKIGPGWDVAPLEAVRRAFPELGIQADANGSYAPDDADRLPALDRFGLLCLEQPLDRHDLDGHAALAARMTTPICLDEGVDSPARVVRGPGTSGPARWCA